MKPERGLHELYRNDPESADFEVFGRISRRGLLGRITTILGAPVVFGNFMPGGLIPAVLADSNEKFVMEGKSGLRILNDRPLNAETPAHLLNDDITPANRLFIRNNGLPPVKPDRNSWALTIGGEAAGSEKSFSLAELKSEFKLLSQQLTLECGGNGRAEFDPPASGNQWTTGAVGCPSWNGIRLRDLLEVVGIKDDAVYVAFYGADEHLSRVPGKSPISRGVPLAKALEKESMVVWGMNGEDLPLQNGYPLRLMFGGWPGSCSGKWLNKIVIRNQVHDGPKMMGNSYRVPKTPVAPGTRVASEDLKIIHSMPVKSLITYPQTGVRHQLIQPLKIHGHTWAGDLRTQRLDISIDFGQSWQRARLSKPVNRLAWQHFDADVRFPQPGYYEVWARATDEKGMSQPMVLPGWNPKGYLNNACHRIAVYAA